MTPDRPPPVRASPEVRGLVPGVRVLLAAFAVLTLLATNQLFVLAEHTASGFAWTIEPPLTAAFLGAGYAAGCVLVLLSLRTGHWAAARTGFLTVLVFTLVALAATLLHLDRFHFDAEGLVPRSAAWIWLVVYVVVPAAMLAVLPAQGRAPGDDPAAPRPLGPVLKGALAAQAAVLLIAGAVLFLVPAGRESWPWTLTPLTARMVASWLVALGVGAVLALREDDLRRLQPAAVTYAVLGAMQLAALVRFPDTVDWARPAARAYVAVVATVLLTGVAGVVRGRAPAAG